jgi:hypothetical protein
MTVRERERQGWVGVRAVSLVLLGGLFACSPTPDRPTEVADEPVGEVSDTLITAAPLPAETVYVEGMPEVMPVVAFRPPLAFPLGFETVIPADMAVDLASSGEADVVRFEAAFGGVRRPDVSLTFAVLPAEVEAEEARSNIAALARTLGATQRTEQIPPWATHAYDAVADTAAFLTLGRHRDHWFYLLARYPVEYGDGMAPRIDLILRRWIWIDDGTPLR